MSSALAFAPQPDFFVTARFNMVESQLRPNGILDEKILALMGSLPREDFVAEEAKALAYSDGAVALGSGRRALSPLTLARMLQSAALDGRQRVLLLGAGRGYTAVLLNELAGEVIALESDAALMRLLQQGKQQRQLDNVLTAPGMLAEGYAAASPYQVIIIEGGIQWLPEKLTAQLAEGGKLLCVFCREGDATGKLGELRLYEKNHGAITHRVLADSAAPLLPGFSARPRFSFY